MIHQSLNRAELIGRVTQTPIIHYTRKDEPVVNLSIATKEMWIDKATNEKRCATEWHRVTAFSRLAEIICDIVRKGSLVHVDGKMCKRTFTDNAGIDRESFEIRVNEIRVLAQPTDGGGFGEHD